MKSPVTDQSEFERFFDSSLDLVCIVDEHAQIQWMNRQWTRILNRSEQEIREARRNKIIHSDDIDRFITEFRKVASGDHKVSDFTARLVSAHQGDLWIRWNMIPLPDGLIGVTGRDISQKLLIGEKLAHRNKFLELAARVAMVGYWRWDLTNNSLSWSNTTYEYLGLSEDTFDVTVEKNTELLHPDDRTKVDEVIRALLKSGETVQYETRVMHADGQYRNTLNRAVAEYAGSGKSATALFGVSMDITEHESVMRELRHASEHDPLTGLANRAKFNATLEVALRNLRQREQSVAVILLDLDNFKEVNDTLGHPIGDRLLQAFSERLSGSLRKAETLARLGGDEFAIIQQAGQQPIEAEALCNRLMNLLKAPFNIVGNQLSVGVSVGVSTAPNDAQDAGTLLRNADIALYRAKSEGRARYRFFELRMDTELQERRELQENLRQAISNNEFVLRFQPVVDSGTKQICLLEALVRWDNPSRGLLAPADFIEVAIETGLVVPIGQWVLREACRQAATWSDQMRVAVNVSAAEFQHADFVESVGEALRTAGLPGHRLDLEITEVALIDDENNALTTLEALRDLGVQTVMDDFGVGYSSLNYLRRFPFDRLKLDASFVRDCDTREEHRVIIRTVANIARALGLKSTAEGVETREQANAIEQEGYSQMQGDYFSRALPADEISALRFTASKAVDSS